MEIRSLTDRASVRVRVAVRRGRVTRELALRDFAWRTRREMGETTWRIGRHRAAGLELWQRRPAEGRVELTAGVTAQKGWTLTACTFEVRVRVGGQEQFTWPFAAGAVVPVSQLASAKRTLELTYPVYASMQWVDAFTRRRGAYAATHDAEPYFKHLQARVEDGGARRTLVLTFVYTDLEWPAGRLWSSPPLVLADHDGDWREGARIYRAWADTWFRREEVPEFLQRSAGHNMISFPAGGGRVAFKDLPRLAAASRRLGLDGVHVADWMEEGFDTFYPAYRPDPTLGGERGLRRAVRRMAAEGSWTCLYTNGRLLDPAGPHGSHAFDWAVKLPPAVRRRFAEMWTRTQDRSRPGWDPVQAVPAAPAPFNRDGTAAEEWWGRVLAVMCPAVPQWRHLWLSRVSDVAATMRPRMLQVDQVCGCWSMPCHDEGHPHACPALAWSGYKTFTRQMRRRAHEVDPEIALWSEGVNDILGQAFDGLQASLGFDALLAGLGAWDPRIFKCTFPEYVLLTGDLDGRDPYPLAWAVITGGHGHFFLSEPDCVDADARRRIRFAARVRSRYWRVFSSTDVFVPWARGDTGVKMLGYRTGRRLLIAGAPLWPTATPDRAFRVEVRLDESRRRIVRAEWMIRDEANRAALRRQRMMIEGRGLFVLWIE